ncbi:unnamed protein product [Pylaiella littoralis]
MYLVNTTRWDISYAVMILTRGMAAPTDQHMVAAKRVLRYLWGTPDLPTVHRKGDMTLQGFTDSDFAADDDTRRSLHRVLVHVGWWCNFVCCCTAKGCFAKYY